MSSSSIDKENPDADDNPYEDLDFTTGKKIAEEENQENNSGGRAKKDRNKGKHKEPAWHKILRAHMIETMNKPFIELYNACNHGTVPVDEYEKLRESLPKSKREFMQEIHWNFDSRNDYQRFDLFLREGRKHLADVIRAVRNSPDYQRWWNTLKDAGRNQVEIEDEIFATCMVEAMRQGYCPFYADISKGGKNKLKPLIVDDYRDQLIKYQHRAKTELSNRVDLFKAVSEAFPSLPNTVSRVPIETDGLFEIEDHSNNEKSDQHDTETDSSQGDCSA